MEMPKTRDEKLLAILNAFTWTKVDKDSPESMLIYNAVMESICKHTKRFQTDFLYDVLHITSRVEWMKAHEELGPISVIAVRESGVDGIGFLYSRLEDLTSPVQVKGCYFDIFYLALELDEIYGKPRIVLYRGQLATFRGFGPNCKPESAAMPVLTVDDLLRIQNALVDSALVDSSPVDSAPSEAVTEKASTHAKTDQADVNNSAQTIEKIQAALKALDQYTSAH